jgi:hypothetical protein
MDKKYVTAPEGDYGYLTPGKKYEILESDKISFQILSDTGIKMFCLWEGCGHLSGGDWIRE